MNVDIDVQGGHGGGNNMAITSITAAGNAGGGFQSIEIELRAEIVVLREEIAKLRVMCYEQSGAGSK